MKLNLSMTWKLSLTPQNMELKKVSPLSPELMLSCCECLYSVCILCALIFKHLLKYMYAIILVLFSSLLYACQWTICLMICFFPMSVCLYLFYCLEYILHKWRSKSIKFCQIMHLWRLKTKWWCPSLFLIAFLIQIISSGLRSSKHFFSSADLWTEIFCDLRSWWPLAHYEICKAMPIKSSSLE